MKIKIERKEKIDKSNNPKNQKKVPTIKLGTHRKLTICLWVLIIASVSFGVYKNFTAIDIHTVHEKEIIEKQIVDTNSIESFVKSFAEEYFSWQQSQDSIDKRNENLKSYLIEELQQLNNDMIRKDIVTSSTVEKVQIWDVSEKDDNYFDVIFSVNQLIIENKSTNKIKATYSVTVYVDEESNLVIIKNPTMDKRAEKSDYQSKKIQSDSSIDATTTEEINEFLEIFFKFYPTAIEQELSYYVSDNALPVINKKYIFVELINPVYTMENSKITANVTVKYLDNETKAVQFSQFELKLEKQDNWKITK